MVRRLLCAGAALVLVCGAVWFVWPRNPQPFLATARLKLQAISAAADASSRQQLASQAEASLQQYLKRRGPEQPAARVLLQGAQAVLGRQAPAAELDLNSIGPADLRTAAFLMFATGHFSAAELLIQKALESNDDREATLRVAVNIDFELRHEQDTIKHCRELISLAPADPGPWFVLAVMYEERLHPESALEAYRKVVELSPGDNSAAKVKVIQQLLEVGQTGEARQEFEDVCRQTPQLAESYPLLEAGLLRAEGQKAEALPLIERVLKQQPRHVEALVLKGKTQFELLRNEAALQTLRQAVAAEPSHQEAYYLLSQTYARLGDKLESQRNLKIHLSLREKYMRIFELSRRVGVNPADAAAREELAAQYDAVDLPDVARFWRNSRPKPASKSAPFTSPVSSGSPAVPTDY